MCLAVPGKVIEIDDYIAKVEVAGTRREANLMLMEDVKVGDYVIVHAGFAIQRMDEAEAEITLGLLREIVEGMPK